MVKATNFSMSIFAKHVLGAQKDESTTEEDEVISAGELVEQGPQVLPTPEQLAEAERDRRRVERRQRLSVAGSTNLCEETRL